MFALWLDLGETLMVEFVRGATWICDLAIALFFYRYGKEKGDLLFCFFSLAFFLISISVLMLTVLKDGSDYAPYAYLIRLAAYTFIIGGIIHKNRPAKKD